MSTTRATTKLVSALMLRDVATTALVRAGAHEADARVQAEHLVEAELRGHPSHGVRRLDILTRRLAGGLIVTGVAPTMTWAADGMLRVDAGLGFGPATLHAALDTLLPRARRLGIATATIARNGHLGMLAPYLERMAGEGFVGIILTTSEGLVHPWGGAGALIGTNPLGIGVPSTDGPLVLDMSTGIVSAGRIRDFAARGEALPSGWAVDADGDETTDAAAAVTGAISPFGGAKGFALGLAFEAMVGLVTGTSYGAEVTGTLDAVHPTTKGDLVIAISVDAAGGAVADPSLAEYLDIVRGSSRTDDPVRIPGDRARGTRAERLATGVPIDTELWRAVSALAAGRF